MKLRTAIPLIFSAPTLIVALFACQAGGGNRSAGQGNAGASTQSGELCDYAGRGEAACDGRRVRIEAQATRRPQQHPILTVDKQQSYWDTPQTTLIFISSEIPSCANVIIATGVLRAHVGPCDENAQNKNQYCGTALEVESYECR
jgi:hypothetical protein